jgi:mannose-6-phosphate isomerase-like protein (cupin superfamily)
MTVSHIKTAVSPLELARSLTELWSPRVIGEVDDSFVKVARVHGDLDWHTHAEEDELFFVLEGRLKLEFEDGAVELGPGQLHVVPKGVRHHPVAEQPCCLLLFEKKSTAHTGDAVSAYTRSLDEQLRPIGS